MLDRIYQKMQYRCPHCEGIIRAPAELIAHPSLAVSPVFVKHVCPKTERSISVRFTITGLRAVSIGGGGEAIETVSNAVSSESVQALRPRKKGHRAE